MDAMFIVVIGRFHKHKQNNRLRTKLYCKTDDLDLNFHIGTLHLYATTFLLHLHLEYTYLVDTALWDLWILSGFL